MADTECDATTDAQQAHPESGRPPWLAAILHRWPTWLAIAMAALLAGDDPSQGLAEALLMLAFAYVAAAVLQRRQATWVVAVVATGALAALRLQDWVEPWAVFLSAAFAFVLWAAVRGQLWPPGAVLLETAGMVGFTALALTALSLEYELGRYLLAAGWFGHGMWDYAHFRANKVVARSFAEWCAVFDVLRAAAFVFLPLV